MGFKYCQTIMQLIFFLKDIYIYITPETMEDLVMDAGIIKRN